MPHNLLTGNSRRLKQEDKLYPREDKTSLPVMYSVLVYLCHASHVSGVALYGGKIDYRWFFYAFRKHPYERWFSHYLAVVHIKSLLWLSDIVSHVMEMGDNPSSNIGQGFSNRYDEALTASFDPISDRLLLEDPEPLQALVAYRVRTISYRDAALFHISTFTDDQCRYGVGARRTAALTAHCHEHAQRFIIHLAPPNKLEIGTCFDPIGARFVLTAGFSCLTPDKRARLEHGCAKALNGTATSDEYESHCGLAAHAGQQLLNQAGWANGIARPLYSDTAASSGHIILTATAHAVNTALLQQVRNTPFVPFFAVIPGAEPDFTIRPGASPPPCITADSCTNDDCNNPGGGAWFRGLYFRVPYSRFWQSFHITCTEALMQRAAQIGFYDYVSHEPLVCNGGDNIAAQSSLVKGSKSDDISCVDRVARRQPEIKSLAKVSVALHISGINLWFADAVSRFRIDTLLSVCAALRLRPVDIGVSTRVASFIAECEAELLHASPRRGLALPSVASSSRNGAVTILADSTSSRSYGLVETATGAQRRSRSQPVAQRVSPSSAATAAKLNLAARLFTAALSLVHVQQADGTPVQPPPSTQPVSAAPLLAAVSICVLLFAAVRASTLLSAAARAMTPLRCSRPVVLVVLSLIAPSLARETRSGHLPGHDEQGLRHYMQYYLVAPDGVGRLHTSRERAPAVVHLHLQPDWGEAEQPYTCVEHPSDLPPGGAWRTQDELLARLTTVETFEPRAKYAVWYDDFDYDDHYAAPSNVHEIRRLIQNDEFAQAWYVCLDADALAPLLLDARYTTRLQHTLAPVPDDGTIGPPCAPDERPREPMTPPHDPGPSRSRSAPAAGALLLASAVAFSLLPRRAASVHLLLAALTSLASPALAQPSRFGHVPGYEPDGGRHMVQWELTQRLPDGAHSVALREHAPPEVQLTRWDAGNQGSAKGRTDNYVEVPEELQLIHGRYFKHTREALLDMLHESHAGDENARYAYWLDVTVANIHMAVPATVPELRHLIERGLLEQAWYENSDDINPYDDLP